MSFYLQRKKNKQANLSRIWKGNNLITKNVKLYCSWWERILTEAVAKVQVIGINAKFSFRNFSLKKKYN